MATTTRAAERSANASQLRRVLGFWTVAAVVVGDMLGSGVFFTPGELAAVANATWQVYLLWALAGGITLCGALTLAELASRLPRAGAPYHIIREGFGPFWAFVLIWVQIWVAGPGSIAGVAIVVGEFLGTVRRRIRALVLAGLGDRCRDILRGHQPAGRPVGRPHADPVDRRKSGGLARPCWRQFVPDRCCRTNQSGRGRWSGCHRPCRRGLGIRPLRGNGNRRSAFHLRRLDRCVVPRS